MRANYVEMVSLERVPTAGATRLRHASAAKATELSLDALRRRSIIAQDLGGDPLALDDHCDQDVTGVNHTAPVDHRLVKRHLDKALDPRCGNDLAHRLRLCGSEDLFHGRPDLRALNTKISQGLSGEPAFGLDQGDHQVLGSDV